MHHDPAHEPFRETGTGGVVIERQPVTRSYDDSRPGADPYATRGDLSTLTSVWRTTLAGTLAALTALLFLGLLGLGLALTQFNAATAATQGTLPAGLGRHIGLWSAFSLLLAFVLGGYVSGRLERVRRPEQGAWRGGLTFLLASPLLILLVLGGLMGAGGTIAGTIAGLHVDPTTQARVNPTAVGDVAGHLRDATWLLLLGCILGLAGSALGGMLAAPRDMLRGGGSRRPGRARDNVERYREPIRGGSRL